MEDFSSTCPIADPIPVGKDGSTILLASKADIDAGEFNGDACLLMPDATYSTTKPLQIWFKWRSFSEYASPTSQESTED